MNFVLKFRLDRITVLEIVQFLYFAVLAGKCHSLNSTQLDSTSFNGRRCATHFCPYLHNTLGLYKSYVSHIFSYSDPSPCSSGQIGRDPVKSYLTSWFIQNLYNFALNKLTLVTSTTWLGKLLQILTARAEK